jgi:hypothetical protein
MLDIFYVHDKYKVEIPLLGKIYSLFEISFYAHETIQGIYMFNPMLKELKFNQFHTFISSTLCWFSF